jgi:tetratricopeptide (TPR) repeat protein
MRAYALLDYGKHDESIADYNYLIQFSPNDPNNYFYRALAKQRKADYKGTIADYSTTLKFGSNGAALLNRSVCYEALKDFFRAMQDALAAKKAGQNVSQEYLARLNAGGG